MASGVLRRLICAALALCLAPQAAAAADSLRLRADAELIESGLIAWLTPRFRFKTRIVLDAAAEDRGREALALVRLDGAPPEARPVAARGEAVFAAAILTEEPQARAAAERFVDWLTSDSGKRAMISFAPEQGARFTEPTAAAATAAGGVVAEAGGEGEKLALLHCGRCHVVSQKNKYGGIGSTPSFAALRAHPEHEAKFAAFWTLNPHPSFTQVTGVTEPFDPNRPPHIAPVVLTLEEVAAIERFVASIPPKDLGAPVRSQPASGR